MKIVFDTNVILSAFLTHGLSSRVLDLCIGLHEIYVSPWILKETNKILSTKFKIKEEEFIRVNRFIKEEFQIISPSGIMPEVCRDNDDNNILHLAEFIKAELIITGDKDLLVLEKYSDAYIITPRKFMEKYLEK